MKIKEDLPVHTKIIKGGICAPDDIKAAGSENGKYGVAIIYAENSSVAGVFTSNKVIAAPVEYTKNIIADGKLSAIIANSGNANCFTGEDGVKDTKIAVNMVSKLLKIPENQIANASTGVIGRKMPMDIIAELIEESVQKLDHSPNASIDAAKAIMTTDTVYKEFAVETKLKNNQSVKIGAITKGTGMIAPNMATMLCFITTDAIATPQALKKALQIAVDDSFNMLVVDGDESTNDTVLIMANGKSNAEIAISGESEGFEGSGESEGSEEFDEFYGEIDSNFQEALNFLTKELTKQMARDGEGATKFIQTEIKGAKSKEEAKIAAKSIISSSLVKSAIFGGDPNWGRIVAAIGYSGIDFDPNKVSIAISANDGNDKKERTAEIAELVKNGNILADENSPNLKKAEKLMQNKEITILVDLNQGNSSAISYGCDLTYDYVKINAEYTT
ncbi:MAG: bifunctional ornithine acetyltransferase/N-acetylglutamate synthase [Methanobrevibacter sp.]|jgi:glutamate N-acetyltransferase/amino-acid N-acetyltransferase|nr:bifunctional ornithine acetyltransferase/N-acetylglutamate synthase [Methanobrevibacter sp.]